MNSKSLVNCFVWNCQYFEKFAENKCFRDAPQEFYHRFMYIAPSSDHSLLIPNLPFKVILRKFEVVFWCLEWECCTFQKTDENSFKSSNTYTMALIFFHIKNLSGSAVTTQWIEPCTLNYEVPGSNSLAADSCACGQGTLSSLRVSLE